MFLIDKILSFFSEKNYEGESFYISNLRRKSIDLFIKKGLSYKEEKWINPKIESFFNKNYHFYSKNKINKLEYHLIKKFIINNKQSFLLIFIDGQYNPCLSYNNTYKKNKKIVLSNIASQKEEIIKNFYGKLSYKYDVFKILNTIFSKDGVYINIPDNVILEKPIEIIYIFTGKVSKILFYPRNLIIVGKSSYVKIIEHHQCLKKHLLFNNSVSEIYASNNSQIDYYKIQNDINDLNLIDNTSIKQNSHSKCSIYTFSLKGKNIKNNLNFYSHGKNTYSYLYGISLLSKKQFVSHQTLIDHLYSNSYSFQLYKNILWDESTSIFNGKIFVNKYVKNINAFQKNNNILLSDKAIIYVKPQLEIFSNNVKCSHGCTIGNCSENELFYLQSRGISEKESRILLLLSFLEEILKNMNILKLKNFIYKIIKKKLNIYL
ncbi:Fe-S cluster assembly protein SufD [Blattabacterium cuenoti]|uniref:Fe-S cluster assembly protein SufD n=1 Tax=Blattabacterium cuenoti TaxID=1653831 RepID=UPI00163D2FF3|nr:Fe-S cluster assembly protein SufD [Blattabacterium cuenoti]